MAGFPVIYTRAFQHQDWIDNVDRVQADGPNGINDRFHGLETEFDTLSGVIAQVKAALDILGEAPAPEEQRLSLVPTMTATAAEGWTHRAGLAEKPAGATSAQGMMPVVPLPKTRLVAFRAIGRNGGSGSLRIDLVRQGLTNIGGVPEQIARIEGAGDPFDLTTAANAAFEIVDTNQFRYFVTARLNGAAAADVVNLIAFQIVYIAIV